MSTMGVRIDQFNKPVCNSFKAKIYNGQVCYEVDLSKFASKESNIEEKLNTGFAFLMDYNEDRQVDQEASSILSRYQGRNMLELMSLKLYDEGLVQRRKAYSSKHVHAKIYLNTIGNLIIMLCLIY